MTRAVAWFRNDLRLKDNPLLHHPDLRQAKELVAVYCVDPRHFDFSRWGSHRRTGEFRARLIAESLVELDKSLRSIGSKLLVAAGRPEEVVSSLLPKEGGVLAFQNEDTSEEQDVESGVIAAAPSSVRVLRHSGQTLLHREDLGWDPSTSLPLPFGKFYHETCNQVWPRRELPAPKKGELPPSPANLPASGPGWVTVPLSAAALAPLMHFPPEPQEARGDFVWRGGEEAALAQLESWCSPLGLGTYQKTRNQLSGLKSWSHLSPWMAIGCLSPRTVYWRAKRFSDEDAGKRFEHFQKFHFQLCWRDYFHFYCVRFGKRVFFLTGPAKRLRSWRRDADVEARWKEGRTGVPLIDALMRELRQTGFMANRGRYIVASYLVHFLNIDWRIGADWFESLLLDHDVCSNYGEWASMANVAVDLGDKYPLGLKGRGPTSGRLPGARGGGGDPWAKGVSEGDAVFDPFEQAEHYDKSEEYVRSWLQELRDVPQGDGHRPHQRHWEAMVRQGYPEPLAVEAVRLSRQRQDRPATSQGSPKAAPAASAEEATGRRWLAGAKAAEPTEGGPAPEEAKVTGQSLYPPQGERAGGRRWRPKFPPST